MPYITSEDRKNIQAGEAPRTPGGLNYCLTWLITDYLKHRGESYQIYNDIIGALECCKLELYRRKISNYENKKQEENGDVYE